MWWRWSRGMGGGVSRGWFRNKPELSIKIRGTPPNAITTKKKEKKKQKTKK